MTESQLELPLGPGGREYKEGFVYLLQRNDQRKIGLTYDLEERFQCQRIKGWEFLDAIGPMPYSLAALVEKLVLAQIDAYGIPRGMDRWNRPFTGNSETWSADDLAVNDIAEVFPRIGRLRGCSMAKVRSTYAKSIEEQFVLIAPQNFEGGLATFVREGLSGEYGLVDSGLRWAIIVPNREKG